MSNFNPHDYIKGLYQVLMSDKKKIGFLFGAGSSLARKKDAEVFVPAVAELTKDIVSELSTEDQKFDNALNEIKHELGEENYNIEQILSIIENKKRVIGVSTLNGLNKEEMELLYTRITDKIRNKVSVHKDLDNEKSAKLLHTDFANWIGQASRKHPIEIFTTNYDYLFEIGLEQQKIPYYDGFSGSYEPFFNPQSVADMKFVNEHTKLWKIHGSLGWNYDCDTGYITRGPSSSDDILIYPSILKYHRSQKQPYVSLMDRLSEFICQEDSILIICGYSFCDEHINERIITSLKSNPKSHVVGLYYDETWKNSSGNWVPEYELSSESAVCSLAKTVNNLSIYGMRSAVIGCKLGKWKLGSEPDRSDTPNLNLYFDEDAPFDVELEINTEKKGDETWTGEGKFVLPDFKQFVGFLNSMTWSNHIEEMGRDV